MYKEYIPLAFTPTPEHMFRFAEIEIYETYVTLAQFLRHSFDSYGRARNLIADALGIPQGTARDSFLEVLKDPYFKASKKELLMYFLTYGYGQQEISKLLHMSTSTIIKYKKRPYTNFGPKWQYWTPTILENWQSIRETIKIFAKTKK